MNSQNQNQAPHWPHPREIDASADATKMVLRIGAELLMRCIAIVALARVGGSLTVTSTGLTLVVKLPSDE